MKILIEMHITENFNDTNREYHKIVLDSTKSDFVSWVFKAYGNYKIDMHYFNSLNEIRIVINKYEDLWFHIQEIEIDRYDKLFNVLENILSKK